MMPAAVMADETFDKMSHNSTRRILKPGRNLVDSQQKNNKGRIYQPRPKSEKYRSLDSAKNSELSPSNLIQKNLDNYLNSLSNSEIKEKLESCPGNLGECPLLNDFRKNIKKSISNHVDLTTKNEDKSSKNSRKYSSPKSHNSEKENLKMSCSKPSENSNNTSTTKNVKATSSNPSKGMIRSTRAQELRSKSNRDLLKPKTTIEKTRTTSPYVNSLPQKKKKSTNNGNPETKSLNRYNPTKIVEEKKKQTKTLNKNEKNNKTPRKGKGKKEKCVSAGEDMVLQRQRTQEIINPKVVKKSSSAIRTTVGDFEALQLTKSQTFFICKGNKNEEKEEKAKEGESEPSPWNPQSDGNVSDDDAPSPKPKPLTHNDSFCLIVKSSQNWSQKNRSDDEKWLHYGLAYDEKSKKKDDKGILKNCDLKSVDSLEKVDSEKIVRFSDEFLHNKKVLKKLVRRKKRIQNFFTPSWYQKNKMFQKYLQVLREKSALLSDQTETPEELKPFQVPLHVKERHEAEMFGLYPRKGRRSKNRYKDAYSY